MQWGWGLALLLAAQGATAQAVEKVLNPTTIRPRAILHSPFEKQEVAQIGTWVLAAHISGTLADAQFVQIDGTTYTGTNGKVYLVVKSAFATTGNGLLDFPVNGKWLLIYDIGTSYYRMYEYTANHDEAAGLYWLFLKTGSPTGAGSFLRGFRFADGAGGVTKRGPAPAEETDELLLGAAGDGTPHLSPRAAEMMAELEQLAR